MPRFAPVTIAIRVLPTACVQAENHAKVTTAIQQARIVRTGHMDAIGAGFNVLHNSLHKLEAAFAEAFRSAAHLIDCE